MHVQIVKFKLKPDASREKFLELTAQMISQLKEMEGFIAYELYESPECWSDRIAWKSKAHAQNGLQAFLSTAVSKQIIPLIESEYSSFFGDSVIST